MSDLKHFCLSKSDFHSLYKFGNRNLNVTVGESSFSFTVEQISLISPKAFKHFQDSSEPFRIETSNSFDTTELISSFSKIFDLFDQSEEIEINENNFQIFSYLADAIGNLQLFSACEAVQLCKENLNFSLSSTDLKGYSPTIYQSLEIFQVNVNGKEFLFTGPFFACISNLVAEHYEKEKAFIPLTVSITDEFDQKLLNLLFFSLRSVFRGNIVDLSQFTSILYLFCDTFEIPKIRTIMNETYPEPITFDASFQIISQIDFDPPHLEKAISFLALNISSIETHSPLFERYCQLPLEVLKKIISNDQLSLKTETFLFEFILHLAESDESKLSLLELVEFAAVDPLILEQYLNKIKKMKNLNLN